MKSIALLFAVLFAAAAHAADFNGQVSFNFNKSNSTLQASEQISANTTSVFFMSAVKSIGTADVTVATGDLPSIGFVMLRNLAATSTNATPTLLIGPDGSSYPLALKAGESALFRWNQPALHLKADTNLPLNAAIRILSN